MGEGVKMTRPPEAVITRQQWTRIASAVFVGAVCAVGFCLLVRRLYPVLWMLAVALLIAYVLDPVLTKLERRGWSRRRAVICTMLCALLMLAGAGAIIVPSLIAQAQEAARNWSYYSQEANALVLRVQDIASSYIQATNPEWRMAPFLEQKMEDFRSWADRALPTALTWLSGKLVGSVVAIVVSGLVILMAYHFMMVLGPLRQALGAMFPQDGAAMREIDRDVSAMLGQYVRGLLTTCTTIALVSAVLFTIVGSVFGVKYGLIVALVNGIGYLVPGLGPGTAFVLAAFFGYFTAQHHPVFAGIANFLAAYIPNQMGDYWLMPAIVGRRVGLHPIVMISALLSAYALWGVPGMLIATPTAASVKIVLARWLPIKQPSAAKAARRHPPLDLDIPAALGKAYVAAGQVTQRVGDAIMGTDRDDSAGPPRDSEQKERQDDTRQAPPTVS